MSRWSVFEPFLVGALNGSSPEWDESWNAEDFLHSCQVHGTAALIAQLFVDKQLNLPAEIGLHLQQVLDGHKVFELLHVEQLRLLFSSFEDHGIRFILLKGTALAYSVFTKPYLRSRGDTDLIIAEEDRAAVHTIMEELGYEAKVTSAVKLSSYQQSYIKDDQFGYCHIFDVHWRVNNRQAFAIAFPWDELEENTMELPRLSPNARSLNPEYQLLHLCLHRVGHLTSLGISHQLNERGDRILWLYEIYLVSQHFDEMSWNRICDLCRQKSICTVILDTLIATGELFPIQVPAAARELLSSHGKGEVSRMLLDGSFFKSFITDLLALPDWRARITLVKEHLFPPAHYMLSKYGKHAGFWLPLLYLRRILGFRSH